MYPNPRRDHLQSSVQITSSKATLDPTVHSQDYPAYDVPPPTRHTAQSFPTFVLGHDGTNFPKTRTQESFSAPAYVGQNQQTISTAMLQKSSIFTGSDKINDMQTTAQTNYVEHLSAPPPPAPRLRSTVDIKDYNVRPEDIYKTSYQVTHSNEQVQSPVRRGGEDPSKHLRDNVLISNSKANYFTTTTREEFQPKVSDRNDDIPINTRQHIKSSVVMLDGDSKTYSPLSTQKRAFVDPGTLPRPSSAPIYEVQREASNRPMTSAVLYRSHLAMGDKTKVKMPHSTAHTAFNNPPLEESHLPSVPMTWHHMGSSGEILAHQKHSHFTTGHTSDFKPPSQSTHERHSMDLQRSHLPKGPFSPSQTFKTTTSTMYAPPSSPGAERVDGGTINNQLRASHFSLGDDGTDTFKTSSNIHYGLPAIAATPPKVKQHIANPISNVKLGDSAKYAMSTHQSETQKIYTAPVGDVKRGKPKHHPLSSNFKLG